MHLYSVISGSLFFTLPLCFAVEVMLPTYVLLRFISISCTDKCVLYPLYPTVTLCSVPTAYKCLQQIYGVAKKSPYLYLTYCDERHRTSNGTVCVPSCWKHSLMHSHVLCDMCQRICGIMVVNAHSMFLRNSLLQ
jgi:hypothetical protein